MSFVPVVPNVFRVRVRVPHLCRQIISPNREVTVVRGPLLLQTTQVKNHLLCKSFLRSTVYSPFSLFSIISPYLQTPGRLLNLSTHVYISSFKRSPTTKTHKSRPLITDFFYTLYIHLLYRQTSTKSTFQVSHSHPLKQT